MTFRVRTAGAVLGLNVALALGYYLAARLGMAAAFGSGQVTAVWPPSGLALAAFMVWGWRAVPGIAAGSLALNWLGFLGPALQMQPAALAGAIVLTTGSLVQAGLAARLLRQVPRALAEDPTRQTLRFAAVVALACTIAASVGSITLMELGLAGSSELVGGWLTWWVGDCAGMLVVAPPLLLWLHGAIRRDPISSLAFPILCMGLGLALVASFLVGNLERETRVERFRAAARTLAMTLQNHVDIAQRDLEVLQASYYKVAIDETEFRRFTTPLLRRSPWQHNFAWLPLVAQQDRPAFERELGGEVVQLIREVASQERVVPALPRAQYLPVRWTDPASGHEALLGVDESADALRGPTIARVRTAGGIGATPPLRSLARAATDRTVFTLYAPIFAGDWMAEGAPSGRPLRGLVSATIDLGLLLEAARAAVGRDIGALLLHDPAAQDTAGMVWTAGAPEPWSRTQQDSLRRRLTDGVHEQHAVRVADRSWQLITQPRRTVSVLAPSWLQVGVFGVGLSFTALLTGFVVARRRRELALRQAQLTLESQVAERTRDLAAANASLTTEVQERRVLEARLREASERAEAANRAKSMFLANMSHEIRTPLNAVLGYTQLLQEDERLDAATQQRLRAILSAGQRLLQLINDVLDLSKIEAGGLTLRPQPFDLAQELHDVITLMTPRAQAKGLHLDVDLSRLGDPQVVGDRAKVGQMVLNLLANAVKFTARGRIGLRAWREDGEVDVVVTDQGPGIAPEELAQLFSPFRQGRAGADQGGTGLGLVLTRGIAQAMGGELQLSSQAGAGTQARLRLPLPACASAAGPGDDLPAEPAPQRLDPATPCRVVVAEDDAASRDILVQALQRIGCEVQAAADGAAALALCRPGAVDVVFTDVRMPVLDGLQLRARLRADPGLARVPVIAVTASSLAHERRHYIEQGFQDFIGKPYPLSEIYQALARHAGVRFIARRSAPPPPAALPGRALPASAVAALRQLAEAAAAGDLHRVQAALAGLDQLEPRPLTSAQSDALGHAARAYDFGLLERLARQRADALHAEGDSAA